MKRLYKQIPLTFLLLILCIQGYCQSDQLYFEQITPEDGLSQNDINCILQDQKGFMWFGTNDGLNRYDGYNFELFKPEKDNPFSIKSNLILSLETDQKGRIWIGTAGFGLSCFDPVSKKFYNDLMPSMASDVSAESHIVDIYVAKNGVLWIASLNGIMGLNIIEQTSEEGQPPIKLEEIPLPQIVKTGWFYAIDEDKDENIWFSAHKGLFKAQLTENTDKPYFVRSIPLSPAIPNLHIYDLAIHETNNLVLSSNAGIIYIKDIYANDSSLRNWNRVSTGVSGEIQVSKQHIWSGTPNGLYQFDMNPQTQIPVLKKVHTNNLFDPYSLSKNFILSVYKDNNDIIWIGTNGGGVNKVEPDKKPFSHIQKNTRPGSLSYNKIRSILEDKNENLWIGTEGGGLNFLSTKSSEKNYTDFQYLNLPKNIFALSEVHIGQDNYLFLGAQDNPGIYSIKIPHPGESFDPQNKTSYPEIPISVFALLNDDDKYLWIGTYNGGLYRMQISDSDSAGEIHRFIHDPKITSSLSNDIIRSLLKDSQGNLWIGTGNGLNKLSKDQMYEDNPRFISYYFSPEDSNSLSHNYILALHETQNGDIYIGTFGGGLNKFIPGQGEKDGHFLNYSEEDGLSNDVVKSIEEDNAGYLWIASNQGLSKLDPQTGIFKNYDTDDGLQSKEFSELASVKRKNGDILFGGVNGFNVFSPEFVEENTHPPEVVFTNFEVVNKPISVGEELNGRILLKKAISETEDIYLDHHENSFSFEFAALHFSAPEKNQYMYKLEGFDENWVVVSSQKRFATYTNLEPGDYTILVRASNNDGIWSQQVKSINIHISSPFWKTPFAYFFYVLLGLFLFWVIRKYTLIGIEEKHQLKLDHIEKKKTEELNKLKLQFFTNISHELKTPLTLISGPIDYLIKNENRLNNLGRKPQYELIKKNTHYLQRLINQLLDFRKIDKGKATLKVHHGNIIQFIQEVSAPFQFIANKKKISYEIIKGQEELELWFDYQKLESILNNLLSNAFKFTPKEGNISIEVQEVMDENPLAPQEVSKFLEIRIRDTGPGIPLDKQKHIFDRFYRVSSTEVVNKEGSGIGLAYSKSLVEIHKGSISVENNPEGGACFILRLPLKKESYTNSEISEEPISSYFTGMEQWEYLGEKSESAEIIEHKPILNREHKASLLIVDDRQDIRTFIRESLSIDYNTLEAANGVEGKELALEHQPDMIISDVMMPEMDGIELCKALRKNPRTSHIPIILLTAKSSEEDEITGLKTGADAYVRKPFNLEVLQIKMRNILQKREELKSRFRQEIILEPEEITVSSADENFLKSAMEIIEDHMADPDFSVETLSYKIGMSRSKMYLKFKAITDQSSSEFIRTIRLKRAVQLLEASDMSVKEIMHMTGFNTASYFSKCFKKQFGMVPSEYVKHQRVSNIS